MERQNPTNPSGSINKPIVGCSSPFESLTQQPQAYDPGAVVQMPEIRLAPLFPPHQPCVVPSSSKPRMPIVHQTTTPQSVVSLTNPFGAPSTLTSTPQSSMQQTSLAQSTCGGQVINKPLVALLDARNCSEEMPILRNDAIFAFCDAQLASEVHGKVLNEAHSALVWSTMELGRQELKKFKALKHLVKIGSCTDNIDVHAAGELGIAVSNVPHCSINEMADSTMSLILNLYRRTHWIASKIRDEGFHPTSSEKFREIVDGTTRIRGQKLGIVGFGRVGSCVVQRARAFGFDIGFYDPMIADGVENMFGIKRYKTLSELLSDSDCVTLHCTLTENTVKLLNESTIRLLKPSAFIINTASVHLIDEKALISALKSGKVKGAALDVYEPCPNCGPSLALRKCPNVIICPRSSWYSDEACIETRKCAAEEVRRGLTGKIPESLRYCVNAHHLSSRRTVQEAPEQPPVKASAQAIYRQPQPAPIATTVQQQQQQQQLQQPQQDHLMITCTGGGQHSQFFHQQIVGTSHGIAASNTLMPSDLQLDHNFQSQLIAAMLHQQQQHQSSMIAEQHFANRLPISGGISTPSDGSELRCTDHRNQPLISNSPMQSSAHEEIGTTESNVTEIS